MPAATEDEILPISYSLAAIAIFASVSNSRAVSCSKLNRAGFAGALSVREDSLIETASVAAALDDCRQYA